MRRQKRVNPINRNRKAREFVRTYHSKERCAFISSLPCCACGGSGSENAHGPDSDAGMGRKGGYKSILPLCGPGYSGCHATLHRIGVESFERASGLDLRAEAARVEERWAEISTKGEG